MSRVEQRALSGMMIYHGTLARSCLRFVSIWACDLFWASRKIFESFLRRTGGRRAGGWLLSELLSPVFSACGFSESSVNIIVRPPLLVEVGEGAADGAADASSHHIMLGGSCQDGGTSQASRCCRRDDDARIIAKLQVEISNLSVQQILKGLRCSRPSDLCVKNTYKRPRHCPALSRFHRLNYVYTSKQAKDFYASCRPRRS